MATAPRFLQNRMRFSLSPDRAVRIGENLLVIALAISLAHLVWEVVPTPQGGLDSPAANGSPGSAAVSRSATPDSTEGPSAAVKRLFGRSPHEQAEAGSAEEPVRETRLDLTLKGILAQQGSDRKLVLIARGDGKEEVYRVGDRIQGAEIVRIETRRVILLRNGVTEALNLEVKSLGEDQGTVRGSGRASGGGGIRKTGEHQRRVSSETVKKNLDNLPKLLQQAKAVPHSQNGERIGFRVVNIQDGSVFQELGIQEGDVIRSVNGSRIRTPQEALKAYKDLKTADSFRVDVLREGKPVTLNYSVQ